MQYKKWTIQHNKPLKCKTFLTFQQLKLMGGSLNPLLVQGWTGEYVVLRISMACGIFPGQHPSPCGSWLGTPTALWWPSTRLCHLHQWPDHHAKPAANIHIRWWNFTEGIKPCIADGYWYFLQRYFSSYVITWVIIFLSPAQEGRRVDPPCGTMMSTPEKSLPANRTASCIVIH